MFTLKTGIMTASVTEQALTLTTPAGAAFVQVFSAPAAIAPTEQGLQITLPEGRLLLCSCEDGALAVTLCRAAEDPDVICHPLTLLSQPEDQLLLAIDSGVLQAASDPDPIVAVERTFCSRENTLPLFATLRNGSYFLTIVETEWDAASNIRQDEQGLWTHELLWKPSLGRWSYDRTVRLYAAEGGVTELAKTFRAIRQQEGLVVPMTEKVKRTPDLEKLYGAANIWLWHDDYEKLMYGTQAWNVDIKNSDNIRAISQQLRENGVDRAVWGIFFLADKDAVPDLEELGYLTGKYECLTDVPTREILDVVPQNRVDNCDYTLRRMKDDPDGVALDEDGGPRLAWELPGTDGKMHPQNKLCTSQMLRRIREELPGCRALDHCKVRFLDGMGVETYECFSPLHPVTRKDSITLRQEAMDYVTGQGLLVGTEDGSDRLAAHLTYNEGLMSPVFFRYDWLNCGRTKAVPYGPKAAAFFDQYLLNPARRVPLWELVYHDCLISYDYWGDSATCCAERMPQRDLFHLLYGQPAMYSFRTGNWESLKPHILASYRTISPVVRQVAEHEMVRFDWLTEDKTVQQTRFANGVVVTVNLSDKRWTDGSLSLEPWGWTVSDL